ncbi:hypothetical protein DBR43_09860 [Pedobacter sp. KBW06]|uniref:OmpH family outer membrane protein n=1 Tax=Pedobacter sp. KBW06 TaxID=2153359 RepID=UPI000F599A1D|nr:OmpH family outer membrane protein [Pedobacter sp. KBW06]RQO75633.1 hypothetical protein DBR43_09860 [Pedobacter sp. KBW06]
MKNVILKNSLLLILWLCTAQSILGQQKIGHVNAESVLAIMPEVIAAQSSLNTFIKMKRVEIDKMQKELKMKDEETFAKRNALNAEKKDAFMKLNQIMDAELDTLKNRAEQATLLAKKEVGTKQAELLTPCADKFIAAVKAVAKQRGLAYVLDSSQQGFGMSRIWDEGIDITSEVKAKLGISSITPVIKNKQKRLN